MAGHSKWAQIKRQKAKNDQARGAVFTKYAREITVAARLGGGDPDGNFRLRTAIERAKAEGLPADNIKRAIQKGVGGDAADNLEEVRYEGYGPGGTAIMVEAFTNNRNRTAADVRFAFTKGGGNMGETGCVSWMFKHLGKLTVATGDADGLLLAAADAGAEDVRTVDDGTCEVLCEPENLETVHKGVQAAGFVVSDAVVTWIPDNVVEVTDPDHGKKLMKLIDLLEEHDDVQAVHHNFDFAEEVAAALA